MLVELMPAAPPPEAFAQIKYVTPNISGRMDNLRAAILRPQLKSLASNVERWNDRYRVLEDGLHGTPGLTVIDRPEKERFVGSSIQFLLMAAASFRSMAAAGRAAGLPDGHQPAPGAGHSHRPHRQWQEHDARRHD